MGLYEGRVALVTGAGSGIGRAAALGFAVKGARVLAVDWNADGARQTVREIEGAGGVASALHADISDETAVADMIAECVARYGRLDAAMNNAGVTDVRRPFHELPLEAWDRMIAVNQTGAFLCMKHEIAQMLEQEPDDGRRGAIVNTSSAAGIIPAPGMPHYGAAKHAVLGLTKQAAQEYVREGIRVNAILPGVTMTGMTSVQDPEFFEYLKTTVPGGELGRAADVAALAVWLCSSEARWVNGQSVVVDGGGVLR